MAELNKKIIEDIAAGLREASENAIKYDDSLNKVLATTKQLDAQNKKADATIDNISRSQKELAENTRKLTATEKDQERAVASLEKQRQRGLAQLAKAEAKERELIAAINKEVKSEDDLIKKTNALVAIRRRLDKTTKDGAKEHKRLTVEINKNTAALKKQDAGIGRFQRNVGNYKEGLNSLKLGYIAVAAAVAGAVRFIGNLVSAADIQQKAEAKLLTALKGREDVQKRLLTQASQLQGITLFGDEEIINAQAYLASLGLNENAIKRLTPLVADLATKSGTDLKSAADLVAKSVGSSTNALSRYGITIEGAVGSNDRLESAISGLNAQVGGQAVAAANAGSGAVKQFSNAWGDLQEQLGARLLPTINKLFRNLSNALKSASQIREEVFQSQLTAQESEDISEFKNFNELLKERGGIVDDLRNLSERFLKVDKDRLALLKEDESANERQIAILETRIRAINGYVDTQISGVNLILEKEEEAAQKSIDIEKRKAEERERIAREDFAKQKELAQDKLDFEALQDELFLENLAEFNAEKDAEDARTQEAINQRNQETFQKTLDLEQAKRDAKEATFAAIQSIFGQETVIGKTALAIQKADAIRSNLISLGVIGAKSAEGQAKSAAAAPFPFNIPLILGSIAQFASIFALFKKAPKFKEGTKGKFSTPSTFIAGEAGTEALEDRKGNISIVDKPTLFTDSPNMKVYSNPELKKSIRNREQLDINSLRNDNRRGFKMIATAIKKQKQPIIQNGKTVGYQQSGYKKKYLELLTK